MKNLKRLLSLVIGLIFLGTSMVSAQEITNNTNCDFMVKITYADANNPCDVIDSVIIPVPVNANVPTGIPAGNVIVAAKGTPGNGIPSCDFYIGTTCTPYPSSLTLPCPCNSSGSYSVGLISATEILIQ